MLTLLWPETLWWSVRRARLFRLTREDGEGKKRDQRKCKASQGPR
jgi:hypothetical protein